MIIDYTEEVYAISFLGKLCLENNLIAQNHLSSFSFVWFCRQNVDSTIRITLILRIVIKIVHKRQYYSYYFPINNTALYTTS